MVSPNPHPRRRRLAKILVGFALLLLGLAASMPVWFPWILRPAFHAFGLHFDRYERLGPLRWAVTGVQGAWPGCSFAADRIESVLPPVWLWHHFQSPSGSFTIRVLGWSLQPASPSPSTAPSLVPISTSRLLDQAAGFLPVLASGLPNLECTRGRVILETTEISIPRILGRPGRLSGSAQIQGRSETLSWIANLSDPTSPHLSLRIEPFEVEARGKLSRESEQWILASEIEGFQNHATVQASFGPEGLWPTQVQIDLPAFSLPRDRFPLEGFGAITGSLKARLVGRELTSTVRVATERLPGGGVSNSPVELQAELTGDLQSLRLHRFTLAAQGLVGQLGEEWVIQPSTGWRPQKGSLQLHADLGKLGIPGWKGIIDGTLQVPVDQEPASRIAFQFGATHLSVPGYDAESLHLNGFVSDSHLVLKSGALRLPDQSTLSAKAEYRLDSGELVAGTWEFEAGCESAWLPEGWRFRSFAASGAFSGPITNLIHSARFASSDFAPRGMTPFDVILAYTGVGRDFKFQDGGLVSGPSRLQFSGVGQIPTLSERAATLRMESLSWSRDGNTLLSLTRPAILKAQASSKTERKGPAPWIGFVEGFHATGPGREVSLDASVTWPREGRLDWRIEGIAAADVADFLASPPPDFQVHTFHGHAEWHDGPLTFELGARVNCTNLSRLGLDPSRFGAVVDNLAFAFELEGSPSEPRGLVRVSADRVESRTLPPAWSWVSANNLDIQAGIRPDGLDLNRCRFEFEKQSVSLTGSIPLRGDHGWKALLNGQLPDWTQARAELRLEDLNWVGMAKRFPTLPIRQGRASAHLRLEPGPRLVGEVRIADASTTPIADLGPIREINGHVTFADRKATLETLTASVAGRTVTLEGEAFLPPAGPPEWRLSLKAEDLPVLRQADLVIRTDLDLILKTTAAMPALSGEVRLRNSLFLRELEWMPSRAVSGAPPRAPYFRISQTPFEAWAVDVRIQGDRFLRIDSPVLRGEASTGMHLTGTLGDPRLTGEAHLDSGTVLFPFTSLRVTQGFASLTAANPEVPELRLTASSRTLGYDVRLEVSGTVEEPMAVFSSNPPLGPEEIVMMLTAGEPPRGPSTATNAQRAGRLAAFIGQDWLRRFGFGQSGPERLIIRSGEEISARGSLTYSVEYRLNDDWSLVAEYDRFNALNAGAKWRLYSD